MDSRVPLAGAGAVRLQHDQRAGKAAAKELAAPEDCSEVIGKLTLGLAWVYGAGLIRDTCNSIDMVRRPHWPFPAIVLAPADMSSHPTGWLPIYRCSYAIMLCHIA
jgi:hypothetical protein